MASRERDFLERINRMLQPETGAETAGLIGASMVPYVSEAIDVADIGLGLRERSPSRVLSGLAGLAIPFVGGTTIRVGAKTLSGRAADMFKTLKRLNPKRASEELAEQAEQIAAREVERVSSSEGIASLPGIARDNPVAVAGQEYAPTEFTEAGLNIQSPPKPISAERLGLIAEKAAMGATDPRSGNAFEFAVQGAWGEGASSAAEIADIVRRNPRFANMSDAEFADQFANAINKIAETEIQLGRTALTPTGEQRLISALFPQSQRPIKTSPSQRSGVLGIGYSGRGLYDVETGRTPRLPPTASQIQMAPRLLRERMVADVLDQRMGLYDPKHPKKMIIEDVPSRDPNVPRYGNISRSDLEEFLSEGRLPEYAGTIERSADESLDLTEKIRSSYEKSLDLNSIKAELRRFPEFKDMKDSDIISVIKSSVVKMRPRYALQLGEDTQRVSGRNAARMLADIYKEIPESVYRPYTGPGSSPIKPEVARKRRQGAVPDLSIEEKVRQLIETDPREALWIIENTSVGQEKNMEALANLAKQKIAQSGQRRAFAGIPFLRAYAGDPTPAFDPLFQYRGAGSMTPKRQFRLENPNWRELER